MSFPRKRESTTVLFFFLDSCFHRNDKLCYILVRKALMSIYDFKSVSLNNQ